MTTISSRVRPSAARRVARGLAPIVTVATVLAAAPAFADVPVGWDERNDVSGLQWLTLLGITLAVIFGIALITLLPGLVRGEGLTGRDEHADDEWFGGPRQHAELPTGATATETRAGGGSGSW